MTAAKPTRWRRGRSTPRTSVRWIPAFGPKRISMSVAAAISGSEGRVIAGHRQEAEGDGKIQSPGSWPQAPGDASAADHGSAAPGSSSSSRPIRWPSRRATLFKGARSMRTFCGNMTRPVSKSSSTSSVRSTFSRERAEGRRALIARPPAFAEEITQLGRQPPTRSCCRWDKLRAALPVARPPRRRSRTCAPAPAIRSLRGAAFPGKTRLRRRARWPRPMSIRADRRSPP